MIAWLIEGMVGATLLMALVLLVRQPVARWCGAGWAYALWFLPLVRLVLPPLPANPLPLPGVTFLLPAINGVAAPAEAAASGSAGWAAILLALWAGGAATFAIWQQSTYGAFLLHLGPDARPSRPPRFGGVRVVESDAVDGPVALGLVDRRIVVPLDFATRYSAHERQLALEHELVHHRRFDLWWTFVALAVLALNWFNPIAHCAFRAFRADQELACDAAVTRRAPGRRHAYACAVVKSASRAGLVAACPLNHAAFLKRRLKMMNQHRGGIARSAGGAATLALIAGAGLALSTPGIANDAAAPGIVLSTGTSEQPFVDKEDLATLARKCGAGDGRTGIVCDHAEADDPEVRAIVARTERRVRDHVAASVPSAAEMARIAEAAEQAAGEAARIAPARVSAEAARSLAQARTGAAIARASAERAQAAAAVQTREDHMAIAREALERARESLRAIDLKAIRVATIEPALAAARARLATLHLSAEDAAEVRADIEEARRDAMTDLRADLRDADEELVREMEELRIEE